MDSYSLVKLVHIISASILFGTGIGTAFFMLRAHLSGNPEAMAVTTKNVVLADWIFTTPAIVVQASTGLWLTFKLAIPLGSVWFIIVVSLFVLIGICWIPVVWIQVRIRNIIANGGAERNRFCATRGLLYRDTRCGAHWLHPAVPRPLHLALLRGTPATAKTLSFLVSGWRSGLS